MQLFYMAGLMALIASPALAQTITSDPQNQTITDQMQVLPPHVGGRVSAQTLVAATKSPLIEYTHQWPGVYFEAAFDGDRLVLKFDDPVNEYRLLIDDLAPIALAQPGKTEVTISDLRQGQHKVRLEKVTESIWMLGAFDGFYIDATARAGLVKPRARQIEFIGDSDMTGYGLRSATTTCTQEEVRLTSDTQAAYPVLVAKHFNADYQINAISGRGLVRNYDGIVLDHTIEAVYERILPDQTEIATPYSDANWQPQIIFIGLGNNDFFSPLHNGEPWLTRDALIDTYIVGMVQFLKTLRASNSNATVMIYWPDSGIMTEAEKARLDREGQSELNKIAQKQGLKPLQFISMGDLKLEASACDFHPSASDQRKKAAWLINAIDNQPQLWGSE